MIKALKNLNKGVTDSYGDAGLLLTLFLLLFVYFYDAMPKN